MKVMTFLQRDIALAWKQAGHCPMLLVYVYTDLIRSMTVIIMRQKHTAVTNITVLSVKIFL